MTARKSPLVINDPISAETASQMLGISKDTLIRKIDRGEIKKAHKMPGLRGPYILDRCEIEDMAAKAAS